MNGTPEECAVNDIRKHGPAMNHRKLLVYKLHVLIEKGIIEYEQPA